MVLRLKDGAGGVHVGEALHSGEVTFQHAAALPIDFDLPNVRDAGA